LEGAPLLRVGNQLHLLRGHALTRLPDLERRLFDGTDKTWWTTLAGSAAGDLFADRTLPGPTPNDPPRVDIVRVTDKGPVSLGPVQTKYPTVERITPLPDGRVLVRASTYEGGVDGEPIHTTEIVPAPTDPTEDLAHEEYYGMACRRRDGSVSIIGRQGYDKPAVLVTWRGGDRSPTRKPAPGLPDGSVDLFETDDGALGAASRSGQSFLLSGASFVRVPQGAAGTAAEALRVRIERARPGGLVPVRLVVDGRNLQVVAGDVARDEEGGSWTLAETGLGLFHDLAPARVDTLGPPEPADAPITSPLPPEAAASPGKPDDKLAPVLDLSRYLAEDAVLALRPVIGRTFVVVDDQILYVDGDTLKSDPALQRGLGDRTRYSEHMGESIGALGGRFPEAAWLQITYRGERTQFVKRQRWEGTEWSDADLIEGGGFADAILPLAGPWALVDQGFYPGMPRTERFLTLLDGNLRAELTQTGLVGIDPRNFSVRAVTALPDGTLFAGLADQVMAWKPDGTVLPLAPLPPGRSPFLIAALSADQIFVLTEPLVDAKPPQAPPSEDRLFHYDGRSWVHEKPPTGAKAIEKMYVGPRGSLWVTLAESAEVLVRAQDGTWSSFEAPGHLDAIWASPAGDVWAVAGPKLLHTKPLPKGFDLAKVLPPRVIEQYGRACLSVTVLVHEVPKTAPTKIKFDDTIRLLAPSLGDLAPRAAYYELTSAGKRFLAMHLPSETPTDEAERAGTALVSLATAKLPGAKPRFVCLTRLEDGTLPRGVQSVRAVGGTADPRKQFK